MLALKNSTKKQNKLHLSITFSQHHHLSHQGTTSVRQPPELSQRRAIIPRSPTLSVSLSPLFRPSPPQHHLPGCHISSHRITTVPLPPPSVDHLHHHQRHAAACRPCFPSPLSLALLVLLAAPAGAPALEVPASSHSNLAAQLTGVRTPPCDACLC